VPRLAVIGFPVGHSRSPAMQSAALAELGLADEWSYGAVEVAPEGLESKLHELAASGYAGLNVTVPHKEAALALADEASEAARAIGAANTLSFEADRSAGDDVGVRPWVIAANTDAPGLLAALPASPPSGARALVLGAGGAARAAVWALVGEEAEVEVWNRTASRAEAICAELGGVALGAPEQASYELIVNTTAVGLRGEDPFAHLPLAATAFGPGQTVVDMVYGERPSALLAAAAAGGAATVDGLEVLVRQGALSLEIWTGRRAPIDAMRAAARA
jgi:shikimate dehydrogenase